MRFFRKSVNLLTGLVLLLTVLVIGTAQASASGNFVPFLPADGSCRSGSGNGQFNYPYGVAMDSDGNFYVADCSNRRIQKFNPNGVFLAKWGSLGTGDGQFNNPIGVAVDSGGNVYAADTYNHRIQKFDSNGFFLAKWGNSGSVQFNRPFDVAVDSGGNVYVADTGNHRIQKFDSSGRFLTMWGNCGTSDGQFDEPTGVTVDCGGNVYVADLGNSRIQKFNSNGVFLAKWGSCGSGDGQFIYPKGIAVDCGGNVYVADPGNSRIQKFNSDGAFLAKWGSYGSGDGQFYNPFGVTVDCGGNVYVADSRLHRIQVLQAPTLKAASTVKGKTAASLGKPGASLGFETAGSVTITAEQAADTTELAPYVTLFAGDDADAAAKAVKYTAGSSTSSFGTDTAYAGDAIANGDFFIIRVTAADATTVSYYKIVVTVNAPAQPVIQSATAGDTHVNINWSPVAGSTAYNIYMSTTSGSYGAPLATVGGAVYSYDASGLSNGTTYYFAVKATNSGGNSTYSNEFSATPQVAAPEAPVLQPPTAGDGYITLNWSPAAGSTAYNVYMSTISGSYGATLAAVGGSVYSYEATGLTNGTTYYFVVNATNGGGNSAYSNEVSATPHHSSGGITALRITTTSLAAGTAGQPYSQAILTNGLGHKPYTFSVTTGILPPSLDLDALTGVISGIPVTAGTYNFTVTVKDAQSKSAGKRYTLTVGAAVVTPATPVSLTDIAGHWAEKNIKKLVEMGAAGGYPDKTFKPDNTITRAEFTTMLVKAFKLGLKQGKVFTDIAGHWARDDIVTSEAWGILSGYSDNEFGPDDPVTREQLAVMVVNALKLSPVNEQLSFKDHADISTWAKADVAAAVKDGIMKGYPDKTFRPKENATRAEAVTVIVSALNI